MELNNIGVSLMLDSRPFDAIATLRDCMALILQPPSAAQEARPTNPIAGDQVEDFRRKAWRRRCTPPAAVMVPCKVFVCAAAIDDTDLFSTLHPEATSILRDSDTFYLIRIREAPTEFGTTISRSVGFQAAVILYNMGVMHLLLSRCQPTQLEPGECEMASLRILHLAYSCAMNRTQVHPGLADMHFEVNHTVLLAIVQRNIVVALLTLRMFQQASEAMDALLVLQITVRQLNCFETMKVEDHPCTAAAA